MADSASLVQSRSGVRRLFGARGGSAAEEASQAQAVLERPMPIFAPEPEPLSEVERIFEGSASAREWGRSLPDLRSELVAQIDAARAVSEGSVAAGDREAADEERQRLEQVLEGMTRHVGDLLERGRVPEIKSPAEWKRLVGLYSSPPHPPEELERALAPLMTKARLRLEDHLFAWEGEESPDLGDAFKDEADKLRRKDLAWERHQVAERHLAPFFEQEGIDLEDEGRRVLVAAELLVDTETSLQDIHDEGYTEEELDLPALDPAVRQHLLERKAEIKASLEAEYAALSWRRRTEGAAREFTDQMHRQGGVAGGRSLPDTESWQRVVAPILQGKEPDRYYEPPNSSALGNLLLAREMAPQCFRPALSEAIGKHIQRRADSARR